MFKKAICTCVFAMSLLRTLNAEEQTRFNRPVLKVKDHKKYSFFKLDGVDFPALTNDRYKVSCLAYRGTENYYLEISVQNKTSTDLHIPYEFITFSKPGYTIFRKDAVLTARQIAMQAQIAISPSSASSLNLQRPAEGSTPTVSAAAFKTDGQTKITATLNPAAMELVSAISTSLESHPYTRGQMQVALFANFLASFSQPADGLTIKPGEMRVVTATFQQLAPKAKPFDIILKVGADTFTFTYQDRDLEE